jgi:hypothetical protein
MMFFARDRAPQRELNQAEQSILTALKNAFAPVG